LVGKLRCQVEERPGLLVSVAIIDFSQRILESLVE
jgi:hypothetical protein